MHCWRSYWERFASSRGINHHAAAMVCRSLRKVEIEPGGTEGPIAAVSVGGLEVACLLRITDVPPAATQVRNDRQIRMQCRQVFHEVGVVRYRTYAVEQAVLLLFQLTQHLSDRIQLWKAELLLVAFRRHVGHRRLLPCPFDVIN